MYISPYSKLTKTSKVWKWIYKPKIISSSSKTICIQEGLFYRHQNFELWKLKLPRKKGELLAIIEWLFQIMVIKVERGHYPSINGKSKIHSTGLNIQSHNLLNFSFMFYSVFLCLSLVSPFPLILPPVFLLCLYLSSFSQDSFWYPLIFYPYILLLISEKCRVLL